MSGDLSEELERLIDNAVLFFSGHGPVLFTADGERTVTKQEYLRDFAREILQAGNDEIARLKVMVDGEWTDCDDAWIERAGRYFEDLDSDPRKTLREKYAPGSVLADVVMHEVWKRDPAVKGLRTALLASQESEKRLVEALEKAAYALFEAKRLTPEALPDHLRAAHKAACEILDNRHE